MNHVQSCAVGAGCDAFSSVHVVFPDLNGGSVAEKEGNEEAGLRHPRDHGQPQIGWRGKTEFS